MLCSLVLSSFYMGHDEIQPPTESKLLNRLRQNLEYMIISRRYATKLLVKIKAGGGLAEI